jgi:7-cyano-7-deazaguanine synthase in queuosine biosynthesis
MAEMITSNRAGPLAKRVLLYSGGMDSVCFDNLLLPDVCLYVRNKAPYAACEDYCVEKLEAQDKIKGELVTLDANVLDLSQWERDDAIVPNRNAHLVLLASNYGDQIYLSSVYGDRSNDKDEKFYRLMEMLLGHMWDEQHWTKRRRFRISSPFKMWTKSTLVDRYLSRGGDHLALLTSYSCYRGQPKHCGICKPCFRKRVALENNYIEVPRGYFEDDFWRQDWFHELLPRMQEGKYRGDEDKDVLKFLRLRNLLA